MRKLDFFLSVGNDIVKIQNILTAAEADGFVMSSDFDKKIPSANKLLDDFRKYNHGNSKLVLHFFYNTITGRKEISYGTKTIYRSYPQYRNAKFL